MAPHYDSLLLLNFGDLAEWAQWAGGRTAVKEVVGGLGDAAFSGPKAGENPTLIGFRKGPRAVRISSIKVNKDGSREVSMEKVREIANLIESRLP